MLEMQAVATTAQARKRAAFKVSAKTRAFATAAGITVAIVTAIMAIAYYGFAINIGSRAAIAVEHVTNTAQQSLQSNFQAPYINHYGFKSLFPAQQRVYADIYRAAYLTRESLTVTDMSDEEIAKILTMVREDSPEMFYLAPEADIQTTTINTAAERTTSIVTLSYSIDRQDVPSAREAFDSAVSEAAAPAASCQSDANKVSMIQAWMRDNVENGQADVEGSAYASLICGQASAAGNAQLFNALCDEVGVDSRTVADSESADATNAVMLSDDWRYVSIA